MSVVQFRSFSPVSFQGNSKSHKKYSAGIQAQPTQNMVNFKGGRFETIEELATRKGELIEYYKKAQDISVYLYEQMEKLGIVWASKNIRPGTRIPFDGTMGLKIFREAPEGLLTPLGMMETCRYHNLKKEDCDRLLQMEITPKLGLFEIFRPKTNDGDFGPTYAITKDLKGRPMPKLLPIHIFKGDRPNRELRELEKFANEVCPQLDSHRLS